MRTEHKHANVLAQLPYTQTYEHAVTMTDYFSLSHIHAHTLLHSISLTHTHTNTLTHKYLPIHSNTHTRKHAFKRTIFFYNDTHRQTHARSLSHACSHPPTHSYTQTYTRVHSSEHTHKHTDTFEVKHSFVTLSTMPSKNGGILCTSELNLAADNILITGHPPWLFFPPLNLRRVRDLIQPAGDTKAAYKKYQETHLFPCQ